MYSLQDVCTIVSGGTPSTKFSNYWDGNIPWISIKDFASTNRYVCNTEKHISTLGLNNSSTNLLQKDDIILSARGTVGEVAIVTSPMSFNQSCFGLRSKSPNLLQYYLFYWLKANKINIQTGAHGAVFNTITLKDFQRIKINVPSIDIQNHIVNTIGSVDELIEKYQDLESKITSIGLIKMDSLMSRTQLKNLNGLAKFEKGYEVGSSNYIDSPKNENNLIQFIRVGDLESPKNCFIEITDKIKVCKETDILIAFDGAPGRLNVGLKGAYSSGIYKVNSINNGLIYFSLLCKLNQKIIKDNSQGTTILHASKAIPFLKYPKIPSDTINWFDSIFNLLIETKKKKKIFGHIKQLLLNKYFTS